MKWFVVIPMLVVALFFAFGIFASVAQSIVTLATAAWWLPAGVLIVAAGVLLHVSDNRYRVHRPHFSRPHFHRHRF
jgi:uncharacterized integral membrane protein